MAPEDLATTVEELVHRIKEAAKAQQIYQPACVGAISVHFWASQVVGALRAVSATPDASVPAPEISTGRKVHAILAQTFTAFLLKILYGAKCWTNLKYFVPIFQDLKALGCSVPCNVVALQKFAEADLTQTEIAPETFASEDLTSRVCFFCKSSLQTLRGMPGCGVAVGGAASDLSDETQRVPAVAVQLSVRT